MEETESWDGREQSDRTTSSWASRPAISRGLLPPPACRSSRRTAVFSRSPRPISLSPASWWRSSRFTELHRTSLLSPFEQSPLTRPFVVRFPWLLQEATLVVHWRDFACLHLRIPNCSGHGYSVKRFPLLQRNVFPETPPESGRFKSRPIFDKRKCAR